MTDTRSDPTGGGSPALRHRHGELGLDDRQVLAMYRTMLLARRLDEKIWRLNRMGRAPFAVSGQGHEAAQVGAGWALRAGHDIVLPYYRDLGLVLTLGLSPYDVLLGVLAKADDPCSGARQMPNHWGSAARRIITGSSCIATQLPHAAGLALASRLDGDDAVTVAFFGEGATSPGDFHEALNFAGVHDLPAVFVCENNGYAISVPVAKECAVPSVAVRAPAYGFPGTVVDGNDPLDVYVAVREAVARARAGEGPSLVECTTYRFMAHTSDDDDRTYRTAEEVQAARRRDPLRRIVDYLVEHRLLSDEDEARYEAEVIAEVDEALARADAAPDPDPATATHHVVAGPPARHAAPASGATTERTVIDTVRFTLETLLEADDRVLVLGEDVAGRGGVFRATDGLVARFGEDRVLDTPLAESSIVGIGIGLALAGRRPIVEIQFADFIHAAYDQIASEAARIRYRTNGDFGVPLVIRTPWGGPVHGALYHSQAIEGTYAHLPGLRVVAPSTPADLCGLLRAALDDPDPVLVLEHKKTYRSVKGPVPDDPSFRVPIGVADVARPGKDLTVVTWGFHRHLCVEAADQLSAEGDGDVEVLDLRTISPFDRDAVLASVARTGRCLVVHEDTLSFGPGAEVAALVAAEAFWDLDAPVRRLATADVPAYPYAPGLEAALFVDTPRIAAAMRDLLAV